jgi:hypothetical protein
MTPGPDKMDSRQAVEVLVPIGEQDRSAKTSRRSREGSGKGTTIGLLNNSKPNVGFFLRSVESEITSRFLAFRTINFLKSRSAGPCLELDEIASQCDFLINAVADCGSCTAWSVHDAIELEKRGVATVTVVTDVFEELAREVAVSMGAPDTRMAVVEHPLGELKEHEVKTRAQENAVRIVDTLMAPTTSNYSNPPPNAWQTPPLRSFEEVNDYFYDRGWTDGLPIVPPTPELVDRFLATVTAADAVIGVVPPLMGRATVERIAVNAAMAGCRPEYLPVIIAAVKGVCHPDFNLLPIQATTNPVTPLIVINGPIVARLKLNSGYNVLGQGWRGNATIGRALRLALVNIGGGVPGTMDKACHGQPGKFSMCIAENEGASPWEPLHVEKGFLADQSTVSVFGVTGTQDIIHYARTSAEEILRTVVHAVPREGYKNLYSGGGPLIIFGPEQAAILGKANLSKKDIKRIVFEGSKIPTELFNPETITLLKGRRHKYFSRTNVDSTQIPIADSEDDIEILVAGGAGNHSVFVPSWGDTRGITIPV